MGESKRALKCLRFWLLIPMGERVLAQSQRTAPPPILKSLVFHDEIFKGGFFNWLAFFKIGIVNLLSIGKTLLSTNRRISFRGSFV
jgi:hypothetical protein